MKEIKKISLILILLISSVLVSNAQYTDTICYGTVPPFISNETLPSGADSIYTFQWQDSTAGNNWNAAPGVNYTISYQGSALFETTYFRRKVNALNCGQSAYSNTIEIIVLDEIEIADTTINHVSCPGGNDGSILITLSGGSGVFNYSWSSGETGNFLDNLQSGTYNYTATDSKGCLISDEIDIITVNENPILSFPQDTIVLWQSDSLTAPGVYYSYSWSNGSTASSTVISSPGYYFLTVSNEAGCESVDSVYVILALSVSDMKYSNRVTVYPNPAREKVYVKLENNNIPEVLTLIDNKGRALFQMKNSSELTTSNLAAGNYLILVTTKGETSYHRVIILE